MEIAFGCKNLYLLNSKQVEDRISKGKDHAQLDNLKDLLAEKNTYMHYFKNEDVKTQEKFCEHSKTNVITIKNNICLVRL